MVATIFLDKEWWMLINTVIAFLLISCLIAVISAFNDFITEWKYLTNEIKRTQGAERRYWIRERRRLWLSFIPFVKW